MEHSPTKYSPHKPALRRADSAVSSGSGGSQRTLLFGEISVTDLTGTRSRSNSAICNLVMSTDPLFSRLWTTEGCRDALLSNIEKDDLPNFRLVCHDFRDRAAPYLFEDISVTFRQGTFTKPARMAALKRVGHHVRSLTFNMPHTPETFLPPLIDPYTGEEQCFEYVPQVRSPTNLPGKTKEPKYGSWEMTELLIQQYPPLFHAATNVPSFIQAFSMVPFLTHLKVSCPGQNIAQRYRRSIVDYALISLRIAIERAYLDCLTTLSLLPIHPSGLFYLQPLLSYGATPASYRRWSRIRKLAIHLDSFPCKEGQRTDHLVLLQNYLRAFSPSLTRLLFRWRGDKGPSPFTLPLEPPCTPPHPSMRRVQAHKPLPRRPLQFPRLQYMELENASMSATSISTFIHSHRRHLTEFIFEDIHLTSGTWDDALAPLSRIVGNDSWKQKQEEVMDVPLVLSPVGLAPRTAERLVQQSKVEREKGGLTMSRWFSRRRTGAERRARDGAGAACEEGLGRWLRSAVGAWR